MSEMTASKMAKIMNTTEDLFRDLPVVIHDGEHFYPIGRISVIEIPKIEGANCIVIRTGDPKKMEAFGTLLRSGKNEDWMTKHEGSSV